MALPAVDLMRRHGEAELRAGEVRANFVRYDWIAGMTGGESRDGRRLLATDWGPVRYGQPHVSPAAMGVLELSGVPDAIGLVHGENRSAVGRNLIDHKPGSTSSGTIPAKICARPGAIGVCDRDHHAETIPRTDGT